MMTKAKRIALFNLLLFKMTKSIKILTFMIIITLSAPPPISFTKSAIVIMAQINQATTMDNRSIVRDTKDQLLSFGQQLQLTLSGSNDYDRESTELLFRDDPTPYFQSESSAIFNDRMTYDDYMTLSMKSILAVAGYDNDLHRYDNHKDLVRSIPTVLGGNVNSNNNNNNNIKPSNGNNNQQQEVDSLNHQDGPVSSEYVILMRQQRQCGLHLDLLLSQHRKLTSSFKSYSQSTNLNLIELIDSFGSPQDSTMRGSYNWLGSYEQCLSAKIFLPVFGSQSSQFAATSSSDTTNNQNDQQSTVTQKNLTHNTNSILPLTPSGATLVNSNLLSTSVEQLQRQRSTVNNGPGTNSLNNVKQMVKTRYCIASFRSPNWFNNSLSQDYPGSFSIKIGVCLPETCNSLSLRNYRPQLERLIKSTRLTLLPYSEYNLIGLYCLPDERSELRQLSLSARAFITFITLWASLVVYYTIKYEYYLHNEARGSSNSRGRFDRSPSSIANSAYSNDNKKHHADGPSKLMKIFSLRLSWNKLFDYQSHQQQSSKGRSLNNNRGEMQTDVVSPQNQHTSTNLLMQPLNIDILGKTANIDLMHMLNNNDQQLNLNTDTSKQGASSEKNKLDHRQTVTEIDKSSINKQSNSSSSSSSSSLSSSTTTSKAMDSIRSQNIIDLSVIDGIKVISMIWLIAAHSLLFFIRNISNGREFWSILKDARFTTIMAGIFPVDTFFTITGILTAYLKFRKDDGKAMRAANYWLDAFIHRYFRFMPMYLIIYWFTKDVSQYVGAGPMWDYATANTSLRSVCKSESWAVPIFFGANFKPLNEHCVKPAWYLANDFQYLLLTPFFLVLLMKSRFLGYTLLVTIIAASLAMQFITVFFSSIEDFEVLANFKPMFGTYILSNLWRLYVLPYNRIPPYLIGLLTGHILYMKEQQIRESQRLAVDYETNAPTRRTSATSYSSCSTVVSSINNDGDLNFYKRDTQIKQDGRLRLLWSIVALVSIIYLPLVTKLVSQHGLAAKVTSSSLVALMRFVWSIAVARLIFVCATKRTSSFISKFLSCSLWKPWSKVGLPALLVQWEIIIYLAQTQRSLPDLNIIYLLGIILISIVITYLFAIPIHLVYENPWSSIERLYIHPFFSETRPTSIHSNSQDNNNSMEATPVKLSIPSHKTGASHSDKLHFGHNVVAT